jgi:hypothetical protein
MLKFLIILVCVFFLIRLIGRMFVVSTFNNLNKKMEEELKRRQSYSQNTPPDGHVSINGNSSGNKSNNQSGEYVDYEEVK